MDDIIIRKVTPKDTQRLLEIYSYYVKNTAITFEYVVPSVQEFEGRIRDITQRYPYLAAERAGRIIGYAYAHEFIARKAYDWSAELTIYIDSSERKSGTGRLLYTELEKELNDIALNKADYQQFIDKVKKTTERWYKTVCSSSSNAFIDKSMLCPSCGKRLYKGKKNIYCGGFKSGCKFSIPYELCQKKLTENQIHMLISSQRTNVIKGFTSKNGKKFDASLKINSDGKIDFIFPNAKKEKRK